MNNYGNVILWGGTGQAKVVADIIGIDQIVAIFDNNKDVITPIPGIPIYYQETGFQIWREKNKHSISGGINYVTSIGWNKGKAREEISKMLLSYGCHAINVIHERAVISKSAKIGINNQILSQVHIGADARIGNNCIINTGSIIEHDCILHDNVDIAPGCTLLGGVAIGKNSAIGAGTIILPRVHIGENVVIGAGSVVDSDVENGMKMICRRKDKVIL